MKMIGGAAAVAAAVFLFAGAAFGQAGGDTDSLIAKAEAAKASGDMVSALQYYTEAVGMMRTSGAPQEKMTAALVKRDTLSTSLIIQLAKAAAQQREALRLQTAISNKLDKIAQIDRDVQARVKRNEDRIKSIETELLDAVK